MVKQRFQHFEEAFALKVTYIKGSFITNVPKESGAHGLTNGKVALRPSNIVSSCATAVKAVQQVIGVAVKPSTGKPVGVKSEPGTGEPSMEFTSIFVGVIPMAVTDNQLQVMLGVKAKIG